ncbi:hypothetical protein ACTMNS_03140, partial [Staphylococcus haemolyticus]
APDINPKPNNLDRRFRIYRETLSRFSCAASIETNAISYEGDSVFSFIRGDRHLYCDNNL